jgi:DNA segregation ATPase FtsK/SpoIIIE, S-DNA-T family
MEFTRRARTPAPPIAYGRLTVDAPPKVPNAAPADMVARLLPVAMVVAAAGMMVLYFTSGASVTRQPMSGFFPVMMVLSLLGTVVYGARRGGRGGDVDRARGEYLRYLDGLDRAAVGVARAQHESLHWSHPAPEDLWTLAGTARMWERTPRDDDFGRVRVGTGPQPLASELVAPHTGDDEESDPVTVGALRALLQRRATVAGVPVTVDLFDHRVVVVDGDADAARGVLRSVVCQLATTHGPDHVAIAAALDDRAAPQWEWLKWLPHHADSRTADAAGPGRLRYRRTADCPAQAGRRVVLVADGVDVTACADGVTVLTVGGAPQGDGILRLGDAATAPDRVSMSQALRCARRLAAYRPGGERPDGVAQRDWLQLMDLPHPGRLVPEQLWGRRAPGDRLRVPIGTSDDGTPVHLDIKEAAQQGMGPHGLCVGATGSGKSEFLRTLALGMIATHSPSELNLILVDFKGGATFLGLDRANHVSAVITNLADEAHLVARMHDALAGEMTRRQEVLRAAGNLANIAEHRRARALRPELAPLPDLLIVVDEFSELLSRHPDFAELFVAIGRLGRSLGMHLLLASQRLDEGRLRGLETHLSYRICLKTFSASESRAVLGVPDAFHLPGAPGAAYLKTAAGELTRLQTAFVSGPSLPAEDQQAAHPPAVTVFTAAPICGAAPPARPPADRSVLDTVLDRIAGHGPPAHRVWLPPLTESPTLDALPAPACPAPLTVPIGLVDSPFEQRRDPLTVALHGATGNAAVIGGPRAGKSTALLTLTLALAATHHPGQLQVYALDFGGGTLSAVRALPHVGAVATRGEPNLVRRVVAHLDAIVRTREAAGAGGPFADVLLIVDGWATVRQEFENLESDITALAARGLSFGVHVVVAASRWAELRPALKDQLGTRIELQLGEPAESEMDRKRARRLTGGPPGRALTAEGREAVIAWPRLDGKPTGQGIAQAIADCAARLHARYGGRTAPPVRLLPSTVHYESLGTVERPVTELVIGMGERDLAAVAIDFAAQPHLVVLGDSECGKTAVLRTLCTELTRRDADAAALLIVDYRRTLLGVVESDHLAGYVHSSGGLTAQLPALLDRLAARMPGDGVTQQQLRARSWWTGPEIFVIVDDYDLVAGATGNPLTPLLDHLPHAKDIGLHVIVARRSGGAARAMFDPLLARMRDLGAAGLMMSAGPEEGVLLGAVRPSPLPPGRATLITRSDPAQLIQVAWTDPP